MTGIFSRRIVVISNKITEVMVQIKMPQTAEAYSFDWGILSMPPNICGKHKYAAISVAYTSMTRVSPFENGSNEMRMS